MSDGAEAVHHMLELPPESPAFGHDVEAETGNGSGRSRPRWRSICCGAG
jgi:hypothetical protein